MKRNRNQIKKTKQEKLIDTLNLLLCHTTQESMMDTIVGLKIVLERLGLLDCCIIWIDTNSDYKARLYYTGKEED